MYNTKDKDKRREEQNMKESLWLATSEGKRFPSLSEALQVPIVIIGGGMTGIHTAYLLAEKGLQVTLVEADQMGYGTSGRSTGKLTPQCGLIYAQIKKKYGWEKLKAFYEANREALKKIEHIITTHKIDCGFEHMPSYLFTEQLERVAEFEEEYEVYQELGIESECVDELALPLQIKKALSQKVAAVFNPKQYMDQMVNILEQKGVHIYEHTAITQITQGEEEWELTANGHKLQAKQVVFCSQYPFYDHYSFYMARLKAEASYIVAAKYKKDFPRASFLSVDQPIHSLRPCEIDGQPGLLIGGESHKIGQELCNHYESLKQYGEEHFDLKAYEYEWSAQCYKTPDELPYIGYLNEHTANMYVATGFNKWGNVNSMVAAQILTDLITYERDNDHGVYDPSRLKGYFTTKIITENANTLWEWIKSKLEATSADLPKQKDTAAVVKIEGKRYGVYRDQEDSLHILDITCPHMGAELNWNQADRTWDCPCHGSRFDIEGKIVEGPATYRLSRYGEGENTVDPHLIK